MNYDWSKYSVYLKVAAQPEKVFMAFATKEGLESFFIERIVIRNKEGTLRVKNELAEAGDHFDWQWHYGRSLSGKFLESDFPNKVRFTFSDSEVVVHCIPHEDGTLIHLLNEKIPLTDHGRVMYHVNCRAAWAHFLTVLKCQLEQGIDIRDTNKETAGSLAVAFIPPE